MLAIALLALVVVGLLVVLSGGLGLLNQANQMGVARGLATAELEAVVAGGWAYHPDGTSFDGATTPSTGGYPPAPYPTQTEQGQTYTLKVDVQLVNPTLRSIRVQVGWGKNHSLDLETLVNP
jgi:hypothetical protein